MYSCCEFWLKREGQASEFFPGCLSPGLPISLMNNMPASGLPSLMIDRNRQHLTPESETLDRDFGDTYSAGKTIYLLNISRGGPEAVYRVFEEMLSWFARNMPSVNIAIEKKAGSYATDDNPLWAEIKKNANAAQIRGYVFMHKESRQRT